MFVDQKLAHILRVELYSLEKNKQNVRSVSVDLLRRAKTFPSSKKITSFVTVYLRGILYKVIQWSLCVLKRDLYFLYICNYIIL